MSDDAQSPETPEHPAPAAPDDAEQAPDRAPARPGRFARIRLRALTAIMALLAAVYIVHTARVWHYENGLRACAMEIIEEVNAEDPIPVSDEGPEADVEVEVTCAFEHILFGEKAGKVRLIVRPRPHAPVQESYAICHIFSYVDGQWKEVESYHEH